jgi:hypothetical protein
MKHVAKRAFFASEGMRAQRRIDFQRAIESGRALGPPGELVWHPLHGANLRSAGRLQFACSPGDLAIPDMRKIAADDSR